MEPTVAVLIPCRDEEPTVAEVVTGFRGAFSNATVYVYDNGSTDDTAVQALHEGAVVVFEPLPGKGRVLRRMFADVYVVADGDGTYDPAEAPAMAKRLFDDGLDMVVGIREAVTQDAEQRGHALGNRLFNRLYRVFFGSGFPTSLAGIGWFRDAS